MQIPNAVDVYSKISSSEFDHPFDARFKITLKFSKTLKIARIDVGDTCFGDY